MERLIASGHKIIFATSYGYLDYAIKSERSIRTSPSDTPADSRHLSNVGTAEAYARPR